MIPVSNLDVFLGGAKATLGDFLPKFEIQAADGLFQLATFSQRNGCKKEKDL